MAGKKFLEQVADYYLEKKADLSQTIFVFPNRRSAMFMKKYMQNGIKGTTFLPKMMSITYFTQQFNESALASTTELVFVLYNVYCDILKKHGREQQIPEFDSFYFWGNIILNDFNEIDAYMVDATQLYSNLKGLKEIKSNYLTPEQIEVAQQLWGLQITQDDENFWQHLPSTSKKDSPSDKFLNLWEIMPELYREFIKKIDSYTPALSYSGLQSRRACDKIRKLGIDDFRGHRYAFVGFNVLSTARSLIFKRLKDMGIAEFFWDIASPLLTDPNGKPTNCGRIVLPLSRSFPAPADFELQKIEKLPDIEIISVPSKFGQAKAVSSILEEWVKDTDITHLPEKAADKLLLDTAIVMADEQLLMPMLFSIPPQIKTINVTMGISYSSTPFAALMSAIISMHIRAREIRKAYHYYYQDILEVLSHPHITLIEPESSAAIKDKIMHDHLFNISADELISDYPHLRFLFQPITSAKDIAQVKSYIHTLVEELTKKLKAKIGKDDDKEYYELKILEGYTQAVEELCDLITTYHIPIKERTFLQMIERTLATTPIKFAGEPLKGLQLMGVMDTRALDFDNVILTSMNERVFPKRNYTPSMIPMSLRAGYLLPTQEQEESTYSYQFFRMISRATKVKLLYDSRTAGISSGEMSRYLSQLIHLARHAHIKTKIIELRAEIAETETLKVDKTPKVNAELRRFLPGGDLRLSASALKAYLSCPLMFYLQYVKRLRVNDEVLEYIDAASYGTVIHRMVQLLYDPHRNKRINSAVLREMLKTDLEEMARQILDEVYYKGRYKDHPEMLPGEGQIVSKIIAEYVKRMLKSECELPPFIFVGAEVGEHQTHQWKVSDKYTINFTMSIDRIDCIEGDPTKDDCTLRFIDYKTGSDNLRATTLDDLFTKKDNGGIFQLLVYSNAYCDLYGHKGKIKPMIYKFQTIPKDGIVDLVVAKKPLDNYTDADTADDTFREKLEEMIDHIFESENAHPFVQTDDEKHCLYCNFKQICNKYPEEKLY